MAPHEKELKQFLDGRRKRNPHEEEFHQAVEEVATSVMPYCLDHAQLEYVKDLKENRRGRFSEMADEFDVIEFQKDANPWAVKCDVAMPCATQSELDKDDATLLIDNEVIEVQHEKADWNPN